jgi:hypothetical protein
VIDLDPTLAAIAAWLHDAGYRTAVDDEHGWFEVFQGKNELGIISLDGATLDWNLKEYDLTIPSSLDEFFRDLEEDADIDRGLDQVLVELEADNA